MVHLNFSVCQKESKQYETNTKTYPFDILLSGCPAIIETLTLWQFFLKVANDNGVILSV